LNQDVFVIHVNQSLEIADLDHLTLFRLVFNQRVDLKRILSMRGQQRLNLNVVEELVLSKSQYFESLFFRDKSAFDSKTLLGNCLSASVGVL